MRFCFRNIALNGCSNVSGIYGEICFRMFVDIFRWFENASRLGLEYVRDGLKIIQGWFWNNSDVASKQFRHGFRIIQRWYQP